MRLADKITIGATLLMFLAFVAVMMYGHNPP